VPIVVSHRWFLPVIALSVIGFVGCASPTDEQKQPEAPVTATAAGALAGDVLVYGDSALTQPWASWSWSSTVALADTTYPLTAGSKTQIKATLSAAWGALSLARTSGDLDSAAYDSVSFDIRSDNASTVYFAVQQTAGGSAPTQLPLQVTKSWSHHSIPLSSVRGTLNSLGKLNFMGEHAGDAFYVDNVQLNAVGTAATIPSSPITPTYESVVTLYSSASPYYLYVPKTYDGTHRTPTRLLVWLHGCGGNGYGDVWSVSPGGSQSWISISLGGRDGDCWDVDNDPWLVMAALSDIKKRLNIDPRKTVVGGYSSGGDLAYKTAFYNAMSFAGVIAENTSPFRDTDSSATSSMGAAAWHFNVAHLAHLQDDEYPIDGVRQETGQLYGAGFPMERIELNGHHWDDDSGSYYGTMADRRTYLLPYLDRGWLAPASAAH
jgi:predicted esterase